MTREAPTAADLARVGGLLYKYYSPSRKPLKPFIEGRAQWRSSHRTIKGALRGALSNLSAGAKIPVGVRNELATFAARWGTETRAPEGVEPVDIQKTVRFSQQDLDDIERAAGAAGVSFAAYVRNAAVMAARKEEK